MMNDYLKALTKQLDIMVKAQSGWDVIDATVAAKELLLKMANFRLTELELQRMIDRDE